MRYWGLLVLFSVVLNLASQEYRSEFIHSISNFELKGNKLLIQKSFIIQVNSRMGDNDALIRIPYRKGEKVNIEEAYIQDVNGNLIRKIHKNEINDQSYISNISLYEDEFIKWADVKHNVYPYQLVYSYKKETTKYNSILSLDYTGYEVPVRKCEINVSVHHNLDIKYKQKNIQEPIVSENSTGKEYKWNFSFEGEKKELNRAFRNSNAPRLEILPIYFFYGKKGNWENWTTFGDWHFSLNKGKDFLPDTEKKKIYELTSHVNDKKEKARILYKYMQEYTRYINITLDVGGFTPYPAEYVCKNRYGDCKALTNYMKTMLKHVGIDSYYTLIYAGIKIRDIDPQFPSNCFNHAILTIPFDKDTIYVECTSKNLPFGYIHSSIQGRQALLVDDEGKSFFTSVPAFTKENVKQERDLYVKMDLNGDSHVKLKTIQKGYFYETASHLGSAGKTAMEKYIKDYILSGTYQLTEYNYTNKEKENLVVFDVDYRLSNFYKKYDNNIVLNPFSINMLSYENPANRKYDLQIDFPQHYTDVIIYDFDDKTISNIPDNIFLDSPYGHYHLSFTKENNMLKVTKSVFIASGFYTVEEYKGFFEFINFIRNNESRNIYIEVV